MKTLKNIYTERRTHLIAFIAVSGFIILAGLFFTRIDVIADSIKEVISYPAYLKDTKKIDSIPSLSQDWLENSSDDFNPNQYYLVTYPASYPFDLFPPKFLQDGDNVKAKVSYVNTKTGVNIQLPPTHISINKGLIRKFINYLSDEDFEYLKNKEYRITNIIDAKGFLIVELAEVLHAPNEGEDNNLPTLKYGIYYIGVKSNDGAISFAKNKTKAFKDNLKSLESDSEFTNIQQYFTFDN